jgi:ADP-heptose:LPS heptosyltransferase
MGTWSNCRSILCIRLDNIGDVLMSSPAMAALKETFGCRITLLTSSAGKTVAVHIPVVDDVLVYDVPWVKSSASAPEDTFFTIVSDLRSRNFDAAVVFTVFSQNPLPAVMLAYLAGIPRRLAYCRENPYALLTEWLPDKEPFTYIVHQVRRDLNLVEAVGAATRDETLRLATNHDGETIQAKLIQAGVDINRTWLVFHPGVSEEKRSYPSARWIEAGRMVTEELGFQIAVTGSAVETDLAETLASGIGAGAFTLAGKLTMEEFIRLVATARLVVSVNTSTIHIAAATNTAVIALYALTNPQHPPWKAKGKVFGFPVSPEQRSKNEVLEYVRKTYYPYDHMSITPSQIVDEIKSILINRTLRDIPELVTAGEVVAT